MKPYLKNGFLIVETLFATEKQPDINYEELGIKAPDFWDPETCDWRITAIRADLIIAMNELNNDYDPNGEYCKIEAADYVWSARCGMNDILELL